MEFLNTGRMIRAILLLLLWSLVSNSQGRGSLPTVPTLVKAPPPAQTETAAVLRSIGTYPANVAGPTITALPGGKVLVFGFDPIGYGWRDSSGKPAITLRSRWKNGVGYDFHINSAWNTLLWEPQGQGWTKIASSPECSGARYLHSATALPNGKVLIAGGLCDRPVFENTGGPASYARLSLWGSKTEAWEAAPELNDPRIFHTATLMKDGSVLLVGGESDPASSASGEQVLDSVERYDGKAVERLPPMHVARARHTATLLRNGTVLVVGGRDHAGNAINSVELWDPLLRTWRELPPLHTARYAHTATLLDDQRVMVAGGIGPDGHSLNSVEFLDLSSGRWSTGSPLPRPLRDHAALRLQDGNVLVAGGASPLDPYPIDWVLLWDKSTGTWHPAGKAVFDGQIDQIYPPTLVPSDDGSVLIFGNRRIFRWRPRVGTQPSRQPTWYSTTSMAALTDGDVMVIGMTSTNRWTANIWHPGDDTWTFAGDLAHNSGGYAKAIQLPAGQVMHVGLVGHGGVSCNISDLDHRHWTNCGHLSLKHRSDSPLGLGLLADGRAVLVANFGDAFLYDQAANRWRSVKLEWNTRDLAYGAPIRAEHPLARVWDNEHDEWLDVSPIGADYWGAAFGRSGYDVVINGRVTERVPSRAMPPSLLWDPVRQRWAYIFPGSRMGSQPKLLPDGCVLSWSPLRLFNPDTGDVVALNNPGIGIQASEGSMLVLADGSAVFSGMPDGGAGPGFFHHRVSCAGFAPAQRSEQLMAGVYGPQSTKPRDSAKPPGPQATVPQTRSHLSVLLAYLKDNPWPLRVVLGVPLLYVLLRFLVLPMVRYIAQRAISREHLSTLTRELPRPFAWGVRAIIYGLLALVCLPTLMNFLVFHRVQAVEGCLHDASACLDPQTGILQSIPALERGSPDHPQPTIPCRFVGLWSSRQGSLMFRIMLKGDGTYSEQPNAAGAGNPSGYHGYWMVQGNSMVWRDLALPEIGPDINPILSQSDGRFVLVEENGRHTLFELIKPVTPDRCK